MAKMVCYCLRARSPFHFGERGVGMEEASVILHSDTLFSALCLTMLELGDKLNPMLEGFPRQRFNQGKATPVTPGVPPFRISSAFPFSMQQKKDQSAEHLFFFPKPFLRLNPHSRSTDPRQTKPLKKIQFVSQSIFESWLAGEDLDFASDQLIQGGKVWLTPGEKNQIGSEKIWVEETQPHVTVDRMTNASQVYSVGQVRFASQAGLFFLIEYQDETWKPILEKVLYALGDSGVGGERSSGKGQFTLEIVDDFALKTPTKANAFTTLSLYWPLEEEVQGGLLEGASYGLILRRGWIGALGGLNLRRRGVRMLTEGSVFSLQPQGALADVKPLDPEEVPNVPHDVWRYGLAFPVPCWRKQEVKDG